MYTQTELMKFSIYAERAHRLAMDIALQSCQLGSYGKGVAVVADECRNIGTQLHSAFDKLCNDEKIDLSENLLQLECMAINGSIESLRVDELEKGCKTTKPLAVIFDEITNLLRDIRRLFQYPTSQPLTHAWVLPKSTVLSQRLPFLHMSIGGMVYVENLQFVREVVQYNGIVDGNVLVRGTAFPVADVGKALRLNILQPKFLVIINAAFAQPESYVAFPVDCLPSIYWNDIGVTAKVASDIRMDFVRECWNCEENQQMIFLNYKNF